MSFSDLEEWEYDQPTKIALSAYPSRIHLVIESVITSYPIIRWIYFIKYTFRYDATLPNRTANWWKWHFTGVLGFEKTYNAWGGIFFVFVNILLWRWNMFARPWRDLNFNFKPSRSLFHGVELILRVYRIFSCEICAKCAGIGLNFGNNFAQSSTPKCTWIRANSTVISVLRRAPTMRCFPQRLSPN